VFLLQLNNRKYSDLTDDLKESLQDYALNVHTISRHSDEDVVFEVKPAASLVARIGAIPAIIVWSHDCAPVAMPRLLSVCAPVSPVHPAVQAVPLRAGLSKLGPCFVVGGRCLSG
jgi:hypothetical protein